MNRDKIPYYVAVDFTQNENDAARVIILVIWHGSDFI